MYSEKFKKRRLDEKETKIFLQKQTIYLKKLERRLLEKTNKKTVLKKNQKIKKSWKNDALNKEKNKIYCI